MVRNIVIVFLSSILIFVLYKYHSTRNYLDFIKNKINTEDMTLYKEGEGHFSIISDDKQFTMGQSTNYLRMAL
jgi:hypothetical protein